MSSSRSRHLSARDAGPAIDSRPRRSATSGKLVFVHPLSPHMFDPVSGAAPRPKAPIACNNCRARKLKCSGARPACSNCPLYGATCEYAAARAKSGPPKGRDGKKAEASRRPRTSESDATVSSPSESSVCDFVDSAPAPLPFDDYTSWQPAEQDYRRLHPGPRTAFYSTQQHSQLAFALGMGPLSAECFAGICNADMSQEVRLNAECKSS